jgi:hypothetical protein
VAAGAGEDATNPVRTLVAPATALDTIATLVVLALVVAVVAPTEVTVETTVVGVLTVCSLAVVPLAFDVAIPGWLGVAIGPLVGDVTAVDCALPCPPDVGATVAGC